jgi:hypothetical protein
MEGKAADEPAVWTVPAISTLETAIQYTVAYADIFDYPLTAQDVHRYLIGRSAALAEVQAALDGIRTLAHVDGHVTLPERESIVAMRRRRAEAAARMWSRALRYGSAIASLPFVRMVAVSGALAVDNVEDGDDIDYLIVTQPRRLWLSRALIIQLVVRMAGCSGDQVCPNYLLSDRALVFRERNLFTAHELAQMVPLAGIDVYARMRRLNAWSSTFLPNADSQPPSRGTLPPVRSSHSSLAGLALRTPVGTALDWCEMRRKVRRFSRQAAAQRAEVAFSADQCKGHFESHAELVRSAFDKRLRLLEMQESP